MEERIIFDLEPVRESFTELDKQVLILRLSFGRLKNEIVEAFAPVAQVVLPLVNQAITAATRLVRGLGGVIRGLLGVGSAFKTVKKESAKIRGSLAGFDELTRLDSAGGVVEYVQKQYAELDFYQGMIAGTIKQYLEPLLQLDFSPAIEAFNRLVTAAKPLGRELFSGFEWVFYNLLVPLSQWTVGEALPAFLGVLTQALDTLSVAVEVLKPLGDWLWQKFLQPLGKWAGQEILAALERLRQRLSQLSDWITNNQEAFRVMTGIVAAFVAAWAVEKVVQGGGILDYLQNLRNIVLVLVGLFTLNLPDAAKKAGEGMKNAFSGIANWFKGIFNGVIGGINGFLSAFASGINALLGALNKINFTIPKWVPIWGGTYFGFDFAPAVAPQIPYLAQGAVLPAGKPFLAMVGDQRHGTNIEAPLATIQEAVAQVMEGQTEAILAGFESSCAVQKEILEAVLGIRIGDSLIAQATDRYRRKMAVVHGGSL